MLTNVVGGGQQGIQVDIHRIRMQPGDQLLLCTDGLTKHVSDARIAEVLVSSTDAAAGCQSLIDMALAAGGSDNVTAVVTRILPG